jgi:hypothetical protein
MSAIPLEQRVATLELELARLKAKIEAKEKTSTPWWRQIADTFANDPLYEEAMQLGRKWRESFRPKPTKRRRKK